MSYLSEGMDWQGMAKDCQSELIAKDARIAALEAENERLRHALQQVEWSGLVLDNDGRHIDLCPLCDQIKEKGHSPDCLVGAALGRQA